MNQLLELVWLSHCGNVPLQVWRSQHYCEEVLWECSSNSTSTEDSALLWRSAVEIFLNKYRGLHTIVKKCCGSVRLQVQRSPHYCEEEIRRWCLKCVQFIAWISLMLHDLLQGRKWQLGNCGWGMSLVVQNTLFVPLWEITVSAHMRSNTNNKKTNKQN